MVVGHAVAGVGLIGRAQFRGVLQRLLRMDRAAVVPKDSIVVPWTVAVVALGAETHLGGRGEAQGFVRQLEGPLAERTSIAIKTSKARVVRAQPHRWHAVFCCARAVRGMTKQADKGRWGRVFASFFFVSEERAVGSGGTPLPTFDPCELVVPHLGQLVFESGPRHGCWDLKQTLRREAGEPRLLDRDQGAAQPGFDALGPRLLDVFLGEE